MIATGTQKTAPIAGEKMKKRLASLLVILLSALSCQLAHTQETSFSIKVKVPSETVKAGSPLKLRVFWQNITSHELPASTDRGCGESSYTINIVDVTGRTPPLTKYGRAVRGMDTGETDPVKRFRLAMSTSKDWKTLYLSSGASLEDEIDLTKMYDLAPGPYAVHLERQDLVSKKLVKSNEVSIIVLQ
jgi:hypothetical protein